MWVRMQVTDGSGVDLRWRPEQGSFRRGALGGGAGGSLRGTEKNVFPKRQFCKKTACSSYVQPWLVAIGGLRLVAIGSWRLATGGWWRLVVVGGGWWLVIGGWWRLAVVGGWRWSPLAVGGGWRLVAVGGWRLVVPWGGP